MKNKKNVLASLARFDHPKIKQVFDKRVDELTKTLLSSSSFATVSENLDELESIALRIPQKSIDLIRGLLVRLEAIELELPVEEGVSKDYIKKIYKQEDLIFKLIEIASLMKYIESNSVLEILFDYSLSDVDKLKNKAVKELNTFSSYNIRIYYGSDTFNALKTQPQEAILRKIREINSGKIKNYFPLIIKLCENILTSSMSDTEWDYDSVIFKTASVPDSEEIKRVRDEAIKYLFDLYQIVKEESYKASIIGALDVATHIFPAKDDSAYKRCVSMIRDNIETILTFYNQLVEVERPVVLATIEDDVWRIYQNHRSHAEINKLSLLIKEKLASNEDYTVFRYLMCFNFNIKDWDSKESKISLRADNEDVIKDKWNEFINDITEKNFSEWSQRILVFSQTESRDMAAFMNLDRFLEMLSRKLPGLALRLLRLNLGGRLVPIMRGLWFSDETDSLRGILTEWIHNGKNLYQIAWLFGNENFIEKDILITLLKKAVDENDLNTLASLISVVAEHSKKLVDKELVNKIFIPSLAEFSKSNDTRWVSLVWYRSGITNVIASLSLDERYLLLKNLLCVESIDHHVECLLAPIAKEFTFEVITYFKERIIFSKTYKNSYTAIPYDFYELDKVFSDNPGNVVDIIFSWDIEEKFKYFGARLLSIIYPELPQLFEDKLISLIHTKDKVNLNMILDVLENYKGIDKIFPLCKSILAASSGDDMICNRVKMLLLTPGVVSGEYGLADEYAKRREIMKVWVNDSDVNISAFANELYILLGDTIVAERNRVSADIELRKHQYGVKGSDSKGS